MEAPWGDCVNESDKRCSSSRLSTLVPSIFSCVAKSYRSCGKQMCFSLLVSMFGRVFSNRWISQISRCSWNIVQDWVVYTWYIKMGKLTNDMIWEASWVRHSSVILLIPSLGFFRLMLRSELIVVSLSLGRSWLWFNCFHLLVLQSSHAWVSVSGDKIGGSWWIEP